MRHTILKLAAALALTSMLVACAGGPSPRPTVPEVERPPVQPRSVLPAVPNRLDLMPYPASVRIDPVIIRFRTFDARVTDSPASARVDFALAELKSQLRSLCGPHSDRAAPLDLSIHFRKTIELSVNEEESYSLETRPGHVTIEAATDVGILRGIATLSQLLSPDRPGLAMVPEVSIHDQPRFTWRGLLLDCARHFMPVDTIKRTLLGMAAVKLNVLHWHLTDDQGFRIESTTFPELTAKGSNGEYYTHADVREIVHYANLLGIRVVPEFDMPAHVSAALAAYPSLAAGSGPFAVRKSFGVFSAVFDPTRDSTYSALSRFFAEMVKLFPDRYIHIGGDENTDRAWANDPAILSYMKAHHMAGFSDLARYFTSRVESILEPLGRQAVVWEESWNGDLVAGQVVQVWAEPSLLNRAIEVGQPVLRSQRYYLDLMFPASYHYAVDPAAGTGRDDAVLGGEAAMWTELVSPQNLDSRLWPRLAAIAERFWSPASLKSIRGMYERLPAVNRYLASIGMRQFADEHRILMNLSGGPVSPALQTLADVLEPLKGYGRISSMHYTTATPLDRTVDGIPPESVAARDFSQLVDLVIEEFAAGLHANSVSAGLPAALRYPASFTAATDKRAQLFSQLRSDLELWRSNDRVLAPLLEARPGLRELSGVSRDLSLIAHVGLSALSRLESFPEGVVPSDDFRWLTRQLTMLRRVPAWNSAQVTVAILDPVRRLVYAACGRTEPR
ncbi:MAG TPA: family 20 glycosylhydrolase [Spirochaetia bacterium]|nr:family 20 glycosylhydrolase [Spirochaetia bacterium]